MFNTKLTQSIAEAAKKVMDEELKGQQHKIDVNKNNKIDAEDFKHLRAGKKPVEEAMQKADVPAYLRKQQGEKPLTVADVKSPRKDSISASANLAKARNEEVEQIEEADVEKTATGMKVYGSSYGNSMRARREQIKKSIDTAKGPKMKDISDIEAEKKKKKKFSEMVETYVEGGIKGLFESFIKEEPTSDEFKSELEKQKAKAEGKAPQADVAKPAVQAVQNEAVEQLDELSPGTLKSYVNKAKPEVQAAKAERDSARQGGDGKIANDAYQLAKKRTAGIKQAKAKLNAEEVERIEELKKSTLGSYVKKASKDLHNTSFDHGEDEHRQYGEPDGPHGDPDAEETMKKRERDIENRQKGINRAATKLSKEEVEQVEERSLTEPEMKKKEEVVMSMKKNLQGFKDRYGSDAKSVMYATATKMAKKD